MGHVAALRHFGIPGVDRSGGGRAHRRALWEYALLIVLLAVMSAIPVPFSAIR